MHLFTIDSKLYKAMVVLWDAVKLNFMWLLFSLPIITIGASTAAAFSVTLKMVEDKEGHVVQQFIKAFRSNFKQGFFIGIITLGVSYCAYLNFEFFNKIENNPFIFLLCGIFIIFVLITHVTYAFPLCARYHNSLYQTLNNSKELVYKFFPRTILMWILVALLVFVFLLNYTLMFIGLLVGPVSIFLVISSFSSRIFKKVEIDSKS